MATGSQTDMQALRRNFNLTDAVCSINEFPQKQVFVPNDASTSEESDGWCHITHVQSSKSILNNNDEDDALLNSKGCQTDDIHLYISDMLISSVEQMQWNELKHNIDFSRPVDPRTFFSEADQCYSMQESYHSCAPTASTASQKREGNSVFYISHSAGPVASSSNCAFNISDEPKAALSSESVLIKNQSNNAEPVVSALVEYLKNKRRRSVGSNSTSCIEGLASYAAAPQKLVPIPNEIPITLDESYDIEGKRVRLRGAAVWAPLKKKFIFDVPSVSHKDFPTLLAHQKYRCAGCGLKLDNFYAKRVKFCHYYSKLFCQCCHQGEKSSLPAQILHFWNFKEYSVCDTAFKFLRDNEDQPVFDVKASNAQLYKKVRNLRKVRTLRVQLSHMWQYVQLCPTAESVLTPSGYLKTMFESIPRRFLELESVDVYSMIDFNAIASKNLLEVLEPIALYGETHIEACVKCRQRAFLCQVCLNADDLLFPFQLDKVYRCDGCGSLTHSKCHLQQLRQTGENKCGKCERIRRKRIRQQRMSEMSSVEYSSE